jgi:hypothetical protein
VRQVLGRHGGQVRQLRSVRGQHETGAEAGEQPL